MQIEVITIGDEILIGQTVDTNSAWLGRTLNAAGFRIRRIVSISDQRDEMIQALDESLSRVDMVIVTGGLGPTKDDITKKVLAEYFDTDLIMNQEVLDRVSAFFERMNRPLLDVNRQQALVPANCDVLPNLKGTASGMWFDRDNKVVVSLPGVPYEMEHLMEEQVIPRMITRFQPGSIVHQTIMTQGIGESFLSKIIEDWEERLLKSGLKLAYLPSPGYVKLRITSVDRPKEQALQEISGWVDELRPLIEPYLFAESDVPMERVVADLLRQHGLTLGMAESCTGGYAAHLITRMAGASDFFKGSLVTYSSSSKTGVLHVDPLLLDAHGAESREVAEVMASLTRDRLGCDYALALTGFAGPSGGTEAVPVGTIFYAVATPTGVVSESKKFGSDRMRNIERSTMEVLNLLRKELIKDLGV